MSPLFIGSVLLLGIRHGIDWDHLAAISDIVSSTENKLKAAFNGLFYALGHAVVVIIIGILAIVVGIRLPDWINQVMEPFVGITLIILGIWLLFSIFAHREKFKLNSRWMLVLKGAFFLYNFFHKKLTGHKHEHIKYPESFGIKSSYIVGTIHGIGAETPTQILLFVAASGVGGGLKGSILLIVFVLGLLISNSLIVFLSLFGYIKAKKNSLFYLIFGLLTAVVSLFLGTLFLFGKSSILPALLGG